MQKFLSEAGVCSRRQGEKLILRGDVRVNGELVTQLGTKVDPAQDRVEVLGKMVSQEEKLLYIALNKPRGYVTSCSHPGDKIVLDMIDIPTRIYPVGRLDKDSTGLLLLTNDGALHHRLSHPSFDHEKEYEIRVAKSMPDGALRRMAEGMPMMGTVTRPAKVRKRSPRSFRITLKEGKNRQIRRMVRKVGNQVTHLRRIRIANIRIGSLPEGSWRYLSEKEKKTLLRHTRAAGAGGRD